MIDPAIVGALVIVTSDHDLLDLGPAWHGRLITTPRGFVRSVVSR